jgi:hypothetical protein
MKRDAAFRDMHANKHPDPRVLLPETNGSSLLPRHWPEAAQTVQLLAGGPPHLNARTCHCGS